MNSRRALYLGAKSAEIVGCRVESVRGGDADSLFFLFLLFSFFFSSLCFRGLRSLGSGGGSSVSKKVPVKARDVFPPSHCDTLHTDLSFAADFEGRKKKKRGKKEQRPDYFESGYDIFGLALSQ